MKKLLFFMTLFLVGTIVAQAQEKRYNVYAVGFYNLENLFDTQHDEGKNDYEYLPDGHNRWTEMKYQHKLKNMSRVLSEMGTDLLPNIGCSVIGVSEVENANCLRDLCDQEPLKKRNFQFVHIEGPDKRGVDCALLYNPKFFKVRDVKLVPYVYDLEKDKDRATRGFLTVSGTLADEHVTIIVCHWPSRGASSHYRELAGRQVRVVKDSLVNDDPDVKVFVMGDMNDDPTDKSMTVELGCKAEINEVGPDNMYNPWYNTLVKKGTGTLMFQGSWNLFDQIVMTPNLLAQKGKADYSTLKFRKNEIFRRDYLFQKEGRYKGNTLRTHAGGVWLDGYSDHLPTLVYLMKEAK
ncbi:MAG: endonuclease/exonuclease/phosphatase family protein [Prevotella sp.]|nr:endonuclease/exonuclease/phosphatase family protein [Prevotella sp.]